MACTGSKKYFKAAARLEKQGLMIEAADYYLQALQRKPGNVDARIKLKEVGQKYMSHLSSEFFRNNATQQTEAALETFEKLRDFDSKTRALNVQLDYPKSYEQDYQQAVETYCLKNYHQASLLVNQKKYLEARPFISKVEKYNPSYKNLKQIEIIATCEPLYQNAVNSLENKNYSGALSLLSQIKVKTDKYKDSEDLYELSSGQQSKCFILFEPKSSGDQKEQEIQDQLFNRFSQTAIEKFGSVRILNNTPFQNAPQSADLNNSTNIDLVQAIRKATGADFFYVFDISQVRETGSGPSKKPMRGYQEVKTRKNDTLVITEYKPFDYNLVTAQRTFSYEFRFKLINAYTNQIVSTQSQAMRATDNVEYNEFQRRFNGDINTLFPYNPGVPSPILRPNTRNWRSQFSARTSLKGFDELKASAIDQNVALFGNAAYSMK